MLLWQPEITELGAEENALKDPGLGFHSILIIKQGSQRVKANVPQTVLSSRELNDCVLCTGVYCSPQVGQVLLYGGSKVLVPTGHTSSPSHLAQH